MESSARLGEGGKNRVLHFCVLRVCATSRILLLATLTLTLPHNYYRFLPHTPA